MVGVVVVVVDEVVVVDVDVVVVVVGCEWRYLFARARSLLA